MLFSSLLPKRRNRSFTSSSVRPEPLEPSSCNACSTLRLCQFSMSPSSQDKPPIVKHPAASCGASRLLKQLKHFFCVLSNPTYQEALSILGYPDQTILDVKNGVLCPSNSHDSFIQEKAIFRQTPSSRLMASRFPHASKLAGIQRSFL